MTVDITFCNEVEPSVYEREVKISVFGRVFCVAKSLVVSLRLRETKKRKDSRLAWGFRPGDFPWGGIRFL